MPELPTCQCNAGLPPQQQLANIYCALYTLAQGGGGVTFPITPAQGGTGITSYSIGDLLYASGAATLSKLADVATGNALISGGVGVAPTWGKIGLATHVSGVLAPANGGTGVANAAGSTITMVGGFGITLTLPSASSFNFTSAAAPGQTSLGATAAYGDGSTVVMGSPNDWMTITIGGQDYRIPLYFA